MARAKKHATGLTGEYLKTYKEVEEILKEELDGFDDDAVLEIWKRIHHEDSPHYNVLQKRYAKSKEAGFEFGLIAMKAESNIIISQKPDRVLFKTLYKSSGVASTGNTFTEAFGQVIEDGEVNFMRFAIWGGSSAKAAELPLGEIVNLSVNITNREGIWTAMGRDTFGFSDYSGNAEFPDDPIEEIVQMYGGTTKIAELSVSANDQDVFVVSGMVQRAYNPENVDYSPTITLYDLSLGPRDRGLRIYIDRAHANTIGKGSYVTAVIRTVERTDKTTGDPYIGVMPLLALLYAEEDIEAPPKKVETVNPAEVKGKNANDFVNGRDVSYDDYDCSYKGKDYDESEASCIECPVGEECKEKSEKAK